MTKFDFDKLNVNDIVFYTKFNMVGKVTNVNDRTKEISWDNDDAVVQKIEASDVIDDAGYLAYGWEDVLIVNDPKELLTLRLKYAGNS